MLGLLAIPGCVDKTIGVCTFYWGLGGVLVFRISRYSAPLIMNRREDHCHVECTIVQEVYALHLHFMHHVVYGI